LQIQKQIEPQDTEEQTGKGIEDVVDSEISDLNKEISEKMDSKIFKSFQHPRFVKVEKIVFSPKRKSDELEKTVKVKKPKLLKGGSNEVKHKFQFH